jgi:maltose/moltooligosaccharide transporter
MQSMFIGGASFIAGFLPGILVTWFGVSRDKGAGGIPQNIMWSFYIGALVFLGAVLYTVFKSKEYPPSDPNWKENLRKEHSGGFMGGVKEIFETITNMPSQMKRLALVNFLTWPGLFLMWFYYSTGVAADIFGGDAKNNSEVYTQGLEHANATSAILNLITFVFSFSLPFIVSKIGKKYTHTVCLIIGGLGLISVKFIHDPWMLYISMGMVGIAWASILSMPYSMLAGVLPAEKMGIYMGVFNFFIVLPEIIASLFFGKIMENFLNNDRLTAVLIGGVLLCIAAVICAAIVRESKN